MNRFIAVDLGNSEVKLGFFEDSVLIRTERMPTADLRHVVTIKALSEIAPGVGQLAGARCPVVFGSVVSWAAARLAAILTSAGCTVRPLTSLSGFGLMINYEHGEPGVDRVAACSEAFARKGGPLILVGAGTAVHTNVVSADGVYLGGAIMPGLRLMSESLAAGTDQIRTVQPAVPRNVLGQSTPECVEIGVYHCWLGGTLRLVELTRAEIGEDARLWLTGGQAPWLEPFVPDAFLDPDLTLYGLARLYLSNAVSE
jgi:type III pantothenate kinase